ncbi:hypothetical protein [Sphingomonas sp. CFBP 8760]|uniref:hypothetical protein n=1 Tax=Sphingomonas sp. CFBP 8760 TaxID=2775282 RepID=UPI00177DBE24|nr:hypothetical protein [Sphingomonas sp. CFBP 8760]MBD8546726.1 hypothetical protein [Sphingomonas sp. CFBP 8760]
MTIFTGSSPRLPATAPIRRGRSALTVATHRESDDDLPFQIPIVRPPGDRGRLARPRRGRSGRAKSSTAPQLYTASIASGGGPVLMQAFHASVARHPMEVVQRLRRRFGDDVVPLAEIRVGFHRSSPIVIALVPETLAEVIRRVERDCGSVDVGTFVVDIEQRVEL